jgi:hypothetical protein
VLVLSKPFTPAQLASAMQSALGPRQRASASAAA